MFSNFEQMDVNNDGVVSRDEMTQFFSIAAETMGDSDFTHTLNEMLSVAATEQDVENALSFAAQDKETGLVVDEDEPGEAPSTELPEHRVEIVKKYFEACSKLSLIHI